MSIVHGFDIYADACLGKKSSILTDGEIFLAFITGEDRW
jgi:hypothetical protein